VQSWLWCLHNPFQCAVRKSLLHVLVAHVELVPECAAVPVADLYSLRFCETFSVRYIWRRLINRTRSQREHVAGETHTIAPHQRGKRFGAAILVPSRRALRLCEYQLHMAQPSRVQSGEYCGAFVEIWTGVKRTLWFEFVKSRLGNQGGRLRARPRTTALWKLESSLKLRKHTPLLGWEVAMSERFSPP
jgi:hypothetical protein